MIVRNTKEARMVKNVVANLAIENMYVNKEFIQELLDISYGKKTHEEVREKLNKEYAR